MSKKDKLSTEAYKGVRDFYPEDQAFFNYLCHACQSVAERFGYAEYHASILEPAELYKAKGAESEEIVNEQTYTFVDRGGREVTLRPEMTPTVARMVAAKRRELGFPLRLFSIPNVFRYERPQRGRLREHWQLNVDIFGSRSLSADAEVIAVAHALMLQLGAKESDFTIKLGSRAFIDELAKKYSLAPDVAKLFTQLLDRRAKMPAEEFEEKLSELGIPNEALSPADLPSDVGEIISLLKESGVTNAEFDPSIVRGFNYYTGVVFEIFDTHPENNRALFGGGRYDNLTELFDDEPLPGVGFGMGDVTIQNFLELRGLKPAYVSAATLYLATASPEALPHTTAMAEELRKNNINVAVDFGEKKLGEQIKTAAKQHIPYLMVVGADEIASGNFVARNLDTGEETKLTQNEIVSFFNNN